MPRRLPPFPRPPFVCLVAAGLAVCVACGPTTPSPTPDSPALPAHAPRESNRVTFSVAPDDDLFAGSSEAPRELLAEARDQTLATLAVFEGVFGEWDASQGPLLAWTGLTLTRATRENRTHALDGGIGVVVGSGRARGTLSQTLSTYAVSFAFRSATPLAGRGVLRYRPALTLHVTDTLEAEAGGKLAVVDAEKIPWALRGPLKALLQTLNADLEASGKSVVATNFAAEFLDGPAREPGARCSSFMRAVARDVVAPLCRDARSALGADADVDPGALAACEVDPCATTAASPHPEP